jgi:hypothetical protein
MEAPAEGLVFQQGFQARPVYLGAQAHRRDELRGNQVAGEGEKEEVLFNLPWGHLTAGGEPGYQVKVEARVNGQAQLWLEEVGEAPAF